MKTVFSYEKTVMRFFAAFCAASLFFLISSEQNPQSLKFAADANTLIWVCVFIIVFGLLTLLDTALRHEHSDAWMLLAFLVLYALFYSSAAKNSFIAALFFALVAMTACALNKKGYLSLSLPPLSDTATKAGVALGIAVLCVVCAVYGIYYYRGYHAPNFDFGLFCNMFYNMKTKLLPLVTSERDMLLSHFAVHISPIYYLLLPFYALFPTPETLLVLQGAVIASGLIPLYLLAKKYKLPNAVILLLSTAYAFSPALCAGTFFGLHENCFLVPLLLWTFYFFESEKPLATVISALLVCMVKEDAAVYIAFFALYVIFGRKKVRDGILYLCLAGAYFIGAVSILSAFGDGVMTNRYSNYIYEDSGFVGMILTVIKNPGYVLCEMVKSAHLINKIQFCLQMLIPLGFIPLCQRKISRMILLLPFVLLHLMTLYQYQFNISFQYAFGTTAFLLYLCVLNLGDCEKKDAVCRSSLAAVGAVLMFFVICAPKISGYVKDYQSFGETYRQIDEILDEIEPEASVICSYDFVAHLSDRDEIYSLKHHKINAEDTVLTDYVIIRQRDIEGYLQTYLDLGYEIEEIYSGLLIILRLP